MGNRDQLRAAHEYMRENLPFYISADWNSCYGHRFYEWQKSFLLNRNRLAFLTAANQVGKASHIDAIIPTPHGFRRYGDIVPGDFVFGRDGKPTEVIATRNFEGRPCYRITFDDQSSIVVDAEHLWVCKGYDQRFRKSYKSGSRTWDNPNYGSWVVKTTKQIIDEGGYSPKTSASKRFVIPLCEPVEYQEKDLFDPYLVGLLLDHEAFDYIADRYDITQQKSKTIDYAIKGISQELRRIGLMGHKAATKSIPEDYLLGSIEQRKALLAGLLDTDGSIYGPGIIEYSTISEKLAGDVAELVRSLGGKAEIKGPRITQYTHKGEKKNGQPSYRIFIKCLFNPFRVKRKADRWYITRYKYERVIYSIEPVESVPTMCIAVNNDDHTYLIGRDYTVTHNSTVQIVKCLNMAMRQDLWPYWFPKRKPKTFIYAYPSAALCSLELSEKWIKDYLPRGEMKQDPRFGWELHKDAKGQPEKITFNSGVTVWFRFYSQAPSSLQASTVDCIFLDEETPRAHYDELQVRTQATQAQGSGYTSMVFTATLGQQYLYDCMERQGTPHETFVGAWKRQISVFDCITYADGSPSEIWSKEYIEKDLIPKYRNERERARRLMGRFVKSSGILFEEFETKQNTEEQGITKMDGWRSFVGIDYGSGGEYGHSSAIVHVKVDPSYENIRVVDVWWSQKRRMTQGDLLVRYKMMAPKFGVHNAFADWGATDLFTLAAREGVRLHKAEKSHDIGLNLLNALFKDAQLKIIMGTSPHVGQLIQELSSVSEDTPKRHRLDDCADALRYAVSLIPMRLKSLKDSKKKVQEIATAQISPREAFYKGLDIKDDPMRKSGEDLGDELMEAISDFEEFI
jgi:phage terminase large subunit-like protein